MLARRDEKGARTAYAKKVAITRSIDAARMAGVPIAAVEFSPDGTIRILTDRFDRDGKLSEFDRLDALGKL
ncbi:hypothetical protein [Novosphingobium ginsenosidimutans]|uniref:Uncharacterized protein n=1 Tax=Novosphingobium ginsenosidimutans TaxID=1176536 RepID=A0A5B8S3D7_9SPHN|nr:hypothetical protein [Novosphingobium ginsenosidimutans]QEA16036.1 hypothetical protein FRF71_07745 [Novosphingobium ginsenosidimutans]